MLKLTSYRSTMVKFFLCRYFILQLQLALVSAVSICQTTGHLLSKRFQLKYSTETFSIHILMLTLVFYLMLILVSVIAKNLFLGFLRLQKHQSVLAKSEFLLFSLDAPVVNTSHYIIIIVIN